MTYALVTGALFRDPETKISKNGKPYVVATIVSKDGDTSTFVNLVAFSDSAKDAILALRAGDALSVQGKATIGVYEKNAEHRPSVVRRAGLSRLANRLDTVLFPVLVQVGYHCVGK
jgi:hypothetical protein